MPPSEVVLDQGAGAPHPFTQCFSHLDDGLVNVSLDAARRFRHDGAASPPMAYEADRCLLREHQAHVPFIEEKAKTTCGPLALVLGVSSDKATRTKAAPLLGKSFHISSLDAFFLYLVRWLPATAATLAVSCVMPDIYEVAHDKDLVLMALDLLLRWPDQSPEHGFIEGFHAAGQEPRSGLCRKIYMPEVAEEIFDAQFLGTPAIHFVHELERAGAPQGAGLVETLDSAELTEGYISTPSTRADLDANFGAGRWRLLALLYVPQSSGTLWLISNSSPGQRNTSSLDEGTIYTSSADLVPEVASSVHQEAVCLFPHDQLPAWLQLALSTSSLGDAYQYFPHHTAASGSNTLIWFSAASPRRLYAGAWDLVFGERPAVITFNRLPALLVAAARRMLCVATGNFFDDFAAIDSADLLDSLQDMARATLGHDELHSCTASRLRSTAVWLSSRAQGKAGRIGFIAHTTRQYHVFENSIDIPLGCCLQCLLRATNITMPRAVTLTNAARPYSTVYADASWPRHDGDGIPRIGWIIFRPASSKPIAFTMAVDSHIDDVFPEPYDHGRRRDTRRRDYGVGLRRRRSYVPPPPTRPPPDPPATSPDSFPGQRVRRSVDGEAVVSCLIRGTATPSVVSEIVVAATLHFQHLQAEVRWARISSYSNQAGSLSRNGLDDAWTTRQDWMSRSSLRNHGNTSGVDTPSTESWRLLLARHTVCLSV